MEPLCHAEERMALLRFREGFEILKTASHGPSAYPKIQSWKLQGDGSTDCCSWDGVYCDQQTGHVDSLDLSSSFLYGSIDSESSLFSLSHLHSLNLADNHFNYSFIPSKIASLSRLLHLNLSSSVFSGQIPSEILKLSNLTSLDLSFNVNFSSLENLLKLETPDLRSLAGNLTNLEVLDLSMVNISSAIPDLMTKLFFLSTLGLRKCGLYGEIPIGIFQLPSLLILDVGRNRKLRGHVPEIVSSSLKLEELRLDYTDISGKLPDSIMKLKSLRILDINYCLFSGFIPATVSNMTTLTTLDLSRNYFSGKVPPLASMSQLSYLSLANNNFTGKISASFANLTSLTYLDLSTNKFSGIVPLWLMNLTYLTHLDLSFNQLMHGSVPKSLSQLQNLEYLSLSHANLSGTIEEDIFLSLKKLTYLQLSHNTLSLVDNNKTNTTLPQFKYLALSECNTRKFPSFLQFQDELEDLFLDLNQIEGLIPEWIWNKSRESMNSVWLGGNQLTGFDHNPGVLPWTRLRVLDLSDNMMEGPPPVLPASTLAFFASGNRMTGEISPLICNAKTLIVLEMSNNNLVGEIPSCLGNSSHDLMILNLKGNHFKGIIPEMSSEGLTMLDLSQNQLQGKVPRSLANCTLLQVLDLGDNQIDDSFPLWLGTLPELQVLILRSNMFHGTIENHTTNSEFPKLRIIDLYNNSFAGDLPLEHFKNCDAMKFKVDKLAYMDVIVLPSIAGWILSVDYTMTITNKGVKLLYEKVSNLITFVDLSSNKFTGKIPDSMESFKNLHFLNLSNNVLNGAIPPSTGNLTALESFDISKNILTGEIPPQLAGLGFLAIFNVSFNHLTGPIPQGKQFSSFQNDSYKGNMALCGSPLSRKCGEQPTPSPPLSSEEDSDSDPFLNVVDVIILSIGFGSGLVVGIVYGDKLATKCCKYVSICFFSKLLK
nr:PREDICTED: receptor like protein 30-like [Daucus carota subsp. sativus]